MQLLLVKIVSGILISLLLSFSYYARTDPKDVARVERQTYVCSEKKSDTVPTPKEGVVSTLGNWKLPAEMDEELDGKFAGCMKGRDSGVGLCIRSGRYVVVAVLILWKALE